jgi:rhodanese-related sulfurtransferase
MKRIVFMFAAAALMIALALPAFAQEDGIQIKEITAPELKKALDSGEKLLVIDARPEDEYAEGHIPGAINISPKKLMFISGYLPQDKSYPLVFYCRGGG